MGDPRVPWPAKAAAAVVACYALSSIDLIPGFIPALGLPNDLILLPLGIMLVVRLMPNSVTDDLRDQPAARFTGAGNGPGRISTASFVVDIWASLALGAAIFAPRCIMVP